MSYRLHNHEAIPDGIKRVVLEHMDTILQAAQATSGNQDEAVHHVRTSLKKMRALLRLGGTTSMARSSPRRTSASAMQAGTYQRSAMRRL